MWRRRLIWLPTQPPSLCRVLNSIPPELQYVHVLSNLVDVWNPAPGSTWGTLFLSMSNHLPQFFVIRSKIHPIWYGHDSYPSKSVDELCATTKCLRSKVVLLGRAVWPHLPFWASRSASMIDRLASIIHHVRANRTCWWRCTWVSQDKSFCVYPARWNWAINQSLPHLDSRHVTLPKVSWKPIWLTFSHINFSQQSLERKWNNKV